MENREETRGIDKLEVARKDNENNEINYMGFKAMPFIIGNETFERLGTIGTLSNLLLYLTSIFNMKPISATMIINVFFGTSNLGTLVGAFLSDTYFGRYKTLKFATFTSFMGLLMIALTATIKQLHPPHCGVNESSCTAPTTWQMVFLLGGFGLMIVGAGGIRPCNLAFGADQFNPNTESGKKGINSFFNWYFLSFSFAVMVTLTLIVYIQTNVSWAIGLGIPAGLMLVAYVVYLMGSKLYVKMKPQGSPMTSVVQVIVVAVKKRELKVPDWKWVTLFDYVPPGSLNSKLLQTHQFRFLDKAAIITPDDNINSDGSATCPWKLCSIQQVEEVKCLFRVLPVWASAITFNVAILQHYTFAVFQALMSDRHLTGNSSFQVPAASYVIFFMLAVTLCLAIYDRVLVPLLQRITGKECGITILQRMGTGISFSVLSMIVSALIEHKRRTIALTRPTLGHLPRKGSISSMSALWLIPQLTIAGIGEAFMAVGQMEFYYKEFPENMRSIGGSLYYCSIAMSSYLSSFLVTAVHQLTEKGGKQNWLSDDLNKGRLDYFYYLLAALSTLNFAYFLTVSMWYKYKDSNNWKPGTDVESTTSTNFHLQKSVNEQAEENR